MNPWPRGAARAAGHCCRLGLALVLISAGALKALDPEGFVQEVGQYGLLSGTLLRVFCYLLIPFEVAVGAALLLNYRNTMSLALASVLMVVFIGAVGFAIATDKPLEGCGCFGRFAPRTPWETLTEDVGFLAAGLAGFSLLRWSARAQEAPAPVASRTAFSSPRMGWKAIALAGTALASTAFVLASPHLPIDDVATALRPGVTWDDLGVALAEVNLAEGSHLVAILGLKDEASRAALERLNALAAAGLPLIGLYGDDEADYMEFHFSLGPAFSIYHASPSDLRRLHRRLPRYFAVRGGVISATWDVVPSAAQAAAALGGGIQG